MEQRKQEIIEVVISKAWEDTNFRKELITDPVQAIEKLTGVKMVYHLGRKLQIIQISC